ncbi:MAG TPA: PSD1 and planctomycete cytochrome C domain-containing protein, partial [Planctomycetota bacterium]|nr:PSD1 and planctomycete cytochrome C domain-containing protein [Planctomycetota bacterium]
MTWSWAVLALAALPVRAQDDEEARRRGLELFEKRVRPVLAERCFECHSAGSKKVKGELRLDTVAHLVKGGPGGPLFVKGDPDKSLLVQVVRWATEDLRMPPKKRLADEEVRGIEEWVRHGAVLPADVAPPPAPKTSLDLAKARQFWSLRPLADPPLPAVRDAAWSSHPVDRFVLAELEKRGLHPVGDADRRTLLRRVSFDLTGLPPTPAEMDAFLADSSPEAYERVVERLLASPAYGERWGRHWLDVVRYSDTAGDNSDYPVPQLYLYRNYVVDAFNRDVPYDRFVREQIAGDLLPWRTDEERRRNIVATGYVASAKRYGSRKDDYPWHLTYEDTIDNLSRTFLGLSVTCARCHDHKFDPVTMEDYYALYGIFASTRYPWPGIELDKVQRDLVPLVPPAEAEAALATRAARAAELKEEVKRAEQRKKAADQAVKDAPAEKAPEAKAAAEAAKKALEKAKKDLENHERSPLPFPTAYAVAEGPSKGNAKVQLKGNPEKPAHEVPRRFLAVLGGQTLPSEDTGSGRRALADWLVADSNPLTPRVLVNRLWHHHFGRGIVPTTSDFGKQGKPPTHPELLDWLARRFVENGWSIKAMHRLMVHSRTYRLSSAGHPANEATDPSNEWLWRWNRRRLDAEVIRDAMLAVAGTLDREPGGEHPFP